VVVVTGPQARNWQWIDREISRAALQCGKPIWLLVLDGGPLPLLRHIQNHSVATDRTPSGRGGRRVASVSCSPLPWMSRPRRAKPAIFRGSNRWLRKVAAIGLVVGAAIAVVVALLSQAPPRERATAACGGQPARIEHISSETPGHRVPADRRGAGLSTAIDVPPGDVGAGRRKNATTSPGT
jgi:hypothetical protein